MWLMARLRRGGKPGLLLLFYVLGIYNLSFLWRYGSTSISWPTNACARLVLLPWISADTTQSFTTEELQNLQSVLKNASMDKTVIVSPLNQAWAAGMVDYFLESFRTGDNTKHLLRNLVLVTLDRVAYERCLLLHPHCFILRTKGVDFSAEKPYMSRDYLKMTSRKISFLSVLLQMDYNVIFSDGDIVWLRNPFPHFSATADLELACDFFNGNETDYKNFHNTGFMHVRANRRTVELFKYWDRYTKFYYHIHDQEVFDRIKFNRDFRATGASIRFMSTGIFSGFCEPSDDLEKVCTMHANCCQGLQSKLADLQLVGEDWKLFMNLGRRSGGFRAPKACLQGCFTAFTSKRCLQQTDRKSR